jgi:hypothetical protein
MEEEYPKYLVKHSTLACDVGKEFVWYVWKIGSEGRNWRCLGSHRSEAEGQAAVEADRARASAF